MRVRCGCGAVGKQTQQLRVGDDDEEEEEEVVVLSPTDRQARPPELGVRTPPRMRDNTTRGVVVVEDVVMDADVIKDYGYIVLKVSVDVVKDEPEIPVPKRKKERKKTTKNGRAWWKKVSECVCVCKFDYECSIDK
jgi:hypothetical protein